MKFQNVKLNNWYSFECFDLQNAFNYIKTIDQTKYSASFFNNYNKLMIIRKIIIINKIVNN